MHFLMIFASKLQFITPCPPAGSGNRSIKSKNGFNFLSISLKPIGYSITLLKDLVGAPLGFNFPTSRLVFWAQSSLTITLNPDRTGTFFFFEPDGRPENPTCFTYKYRYSTCITHSGTHDYNHHDNITSGKPF